MSPFAIKGSMLFRVRNPECVCIGISPVRSPSHHSTVPSLSDAKALSEGSAKSEKLSVYKATHTTSARRGKGVLREFVGDCPSAARARNGLLSTTGAKPSSDKAGRAG